MLGFNKLMPGRLGVARLEFEGTEHERRIGVLGIDSM